MLNTACMLRETSRKSKAKPGRAKYVGIVADAAALDVDRIHLWKVLSGRRASKSLLARYRQLKQKQSLAA
jgi:hypothetical protein